MRIRHLIHFLPSWGFAVIPQRPDYDLLPTLTQVILQPFVVFRINVTEWAESSE